MAISNTKAGKGKVIKQNHANFEAFDNRYGSLFRKMHKHVTGKDAMKVTRQLYDGLILQVTSCPLDLFVEDMIYNNHPNMRPAQLLSLMIAEKEFIAQANNKAITSAVPLKIAQINKVLNIVSSMHFRQMFGFDFIKEYHPSKFELTQASDLYEEYKAYIDTYKPGDEFELLDYFADSLGVADFFSIDDEPQEDERLKPSVATDDETRERITDEIYERGTKPHMSSEDVDAENAAFALNHQDGADYKQTMMMAMYMLGAMQYFKKLSVAKVSNIALEIAKLGIDGIDPEKKYTLTTIPGKEFGGWELLAYYYVSWAWTHPEFLEKLQLPFDKAYEMALAMYKSKNK